MPSRFSLIFLIKQHFRDFNVFDFSFYFCHFNRNIPVLCVRLQAGMDMAIVNAGALPIYDDIEPELRQLCEVRTFTNVHFFFVD